MPPVFPFGFVAPAIVPGAALLDESGNALLDEAGNVLLDESAPD